MRKKMAVLLLSTVVTIILIFCYPEPLSGPSDNELISRSELIAKLPINQAVKLSTIVKRPFDRVYVLGGYDDSVIDGLPDSLLIYKFLTAVSYYGDDSTCALIFVSKTRSVHLTRLGGSGKFGVLSVGEAKSMSKELPHGFVPVLYAAADEASVMVYHTKETDYLILGKMR